ncbi:MAG TPA: S-layer homology domain-containing protein [Terriglobales bacterium]|nr:S-layer homology domain-containing protein [Terriglobales bacterium]
MKLTGREKILVTLLLFCFASYMLFRYVVTPQLAHLEVLRAEHAAWQEQKRALDVIDETMARYGQQQEELTNRIEAIGNNYFSSLSQQEESVIVLNELLLDSGLKDISLAFSPLAPSLPGGAANAAAAGAAPASSDALVQKVQLTYSGSYDALWKALGGFWNFQKCIQVDSITIGQGTDGSGLVTGEISLSLYDLSQVTGLGKNMVIWSDNGQFRRANPFENIGGETFVGTRYILDLSDSTMKFYERFTDISGNWAETAIDDFGKRYLVEGDAENRFHPDDPMTRGEFVVLLDKYFQWEAPEDAVDLTVFSDYAELGSSLSAMEKGFYKGYMMGYFIGYDDGTLRPNSPTLYKEFNLVMGKVLNQPEFNWRDAALAIQQQTGYTSPGLVDENASMARAEVVYFLHSLPQQ